MNFINELKKRNVIRVAMAYVVIAWLLIQVLSLAANSFEAPVWVMKMIITAIAIGFFPVVIFSWAFELTPQGIKKEGDLARDEATTSNTSKKFNYITIAAALGVLGLFAFQQMNPPVAQIQQQADEKEAKTNTPVVAIDVKESEGSSLAVMPFDDFSSEKDQEYFANGISEELLNVLSRIEGLRVPSRTSAFAFRGKETPIADIGEALKVQHILEGSIRKAGSTLRITAQLIDTKTDVHMWSETYDRPLTADNIFAIQDEIAAAIVGELRGHLKFDASKSASVRTASVEALQLYLRARENMNKRKPEALSLAVDGFKQVIALDPDFAPAYSGLADTYTLMTSYAAFDLQKAIALVTPMIDKALELAPNSAEALTSAAGAMVVNEGEIQNALILVNKAIIANPNYVPAYQLKAGIQNLNNLDESLATYKKALELDPLSAFLLSSIARVQLELGDVEGARKTSEDNIRWNPDSPFGYKQLAEIHLDQGDYKAAHGFFKDAQALNASDSGTQNGLVSVYLDVGLIDKARRLATRPEIKMKVHFRLGENRKVRLLYDQIPAGYQVDMSFILRDYEQFIELTSPLMPTVLPEGQAIETERHQWVATTLAFAFRALNRPEANRYMALLDNYFDGKSPTDFQKANRLYYGALYEMTKDNPERVYDWLEQMVSQGFSIAGLVNEHAFEPLHGTPEFDAILARGAENAARHRKVIEDQLANPKPNWVEIDG